MLTTKPMTKNKTTLDSITIFSILFVLKLVVYLDAYN